VIQAGGGFAVGRGPGFEAQPARGPDLSARGGIDQPALSRLENGHTPNPTLDTLWRYAAAAGKRLALSAEDIPDTRPSGREGLP
jgi:transcriptional regulator with XRE-family HTH domain